MSYFRREALHTLAALLITVLVAVAAEVAKIESFQTVSVTGLVLTAVRSLATAIVVLGADRVIKR